MSEKQPVHNEHVLLQQMNQLSPFKQNQSQTPSLVSNMCMTEEEKSIITMDFDFIPEYLCSTNPSFENQIKCILPSTINLEELRDIAILMHKIMSIEMIQSLWIMYQKSGMGHLSIASSSIRTNQIDGKVWPKEVQSLLKRSQTIHVDEDRACLMFVNYCLNDLNKKSDHYRQELNRKTSRQRDYSRSLEHNIEKYLEQNLQMLRMEIDEKITMVQYNYTDEILHRVYLAEKPNENQIQIMKRLCKLKSHQEMTKYEVNFLKTKISLHFTSHPFECESIAQSSLINSLTNKELQTEFYKQLKDVAEQARTKMMNTYMECAEGQKQQTQKHFDNEIKDIQNTQQLTLSMWNIIKERLTNMSARIECLYKFKTELFRLQQLNNQ
ncbi:unnamed protein product [Adineta ricciae]|uniref:Uncharacterized protein n=1 Tax=Adineta ricciae TaxID=249248 RepID=A0A815VFH2_ADIRI|nr:unnamed protein product [Adineta ricciae]CAF1529842.1 unnamed protein product [Adineta ricciae]